MFTFINTLRVLAAIAFIAMAMPGSAAPFLINAQQADYRSTPEYVRDHFAHIDSLPFDGMTITTRSGTGLMNGTVRSHAEIADDFAALNGLAFTRMKHYYAHVNVDRPADFFGDWSATVENFRRFARVLKEQGIEGIFFDNEEYVRLLFNYPDDCDDPAKTLDEYREQARLRGRQIAQAISGEYPDIVFVVYHGPYSSFSGTPDEVRGGQTNWELDELRGPFSVGIIEGLDSRARFVDGGEVFAYRTVEDFQLSYDFRKTGIASAEANCPYISNYLRPVWAAKVRISFGVYNFPFAGQSMDPWTMRTTLERALKRCDDFVWLYCENLNWNAPAGLPVPWVDAVLGARAAAQHPAAEIAPWVSITSPAVASRFNAPAVIHLAANASDADGVVTRVEFFNGTTKLGESVSPPFNYTWTNPVPGDYTLTATATDDGGTTTTSSMVEVTVGATVSACINFQPGDVTAPGGYCADTGEEYAMRENGLTYGWNVDHTESVRHRRDDVDLRLATLCEIQSGGVWEIEVPNGIYQATIVAGDGTYPSNHTLNVEGVNVWDARALSPGMFLGRTVIATVNDGRLTIDSGDAEHSATRISYVCISSLFSPPARPTSLKATAFSSEMVGLKWADNSSTEIGFQVQRGTNPDFSTGTLLATLPAATTTFLDASVSAGTVYYYRVRSIGAAGNSTFSTNASATPRMADLDADGIPDQWEGAPCIVGVDDRHVDSDRDGFSNAAEYIAGTNLLDPGSYLKTTRVTASTTESATIDFTLDFPSVAGRRYFVDFSDDLAGEIWTLVPGSERIGDGAMQSVTAPSSSPARYFRLRAWK